MAVQEPRSNWGVILDKVQSLLGFFVLIALIIDGAFIVTSLDEKKSLAAPTILLFILVIGVLIIAYYKPLAFYHPKDWPLDTPKSINVTLEPIYGNPREKLDFDLDQCFLVVYDKNSKKLPKKANLNYDRELRRWYCFINEDIEQFGGIGLDLKEKNGQKWQMAKFNPYIRKEEITKDLSES